MEKNHRPSAARKAWIFILAISLVAMARLDAQNSTPPDSIGTEGKKFFKPEDIGAATILEARDFNKGVIHHPLQLAQGRVAGLLVSRPGGDPNGNFQSRLRGLHTLQEGYAEPLIVVDGFPQVSLLSIDPEDIASITVLKDAASAAKYGLRGGAGVILIQTRQVKDPGLRVQYKGAVSLETVAQAPDMLDASGYRRIYSDPNSPFFNPGADLGSSTNWIKEITRSGFGQWHQLDIGYGGKQGDYRFALHFRDAEGIARNSGYNQVNGRLSARQRIWNDRIDIGADLAYTRRNAQHIVPDVFRQATAFNPTAPVRSDTALSTGGYAQVLTFRMANPVALIEQPLGEGVQNVATANVNGSWQIIPGLHLSGRFAVQQFEGLQGFAAQSDEFVFGWGNGGFAQRYSDKTLNQFGEAAMSYSVAVGRQRLGLSGGYSSQNVAYETEYREGRNWLVPGFSYEDLLLEDRYLFSTRAADKATHQLTGFWGGAQLDMSNGLQVSAMLRREGSSRLGRNGKWAWLPAIHAAWDLRRIFNAGTWDALRLRSSYGWAGNVPQRSYLSLLNWVGGTPFLIEGAYAPTQIPLHYGNPDLTREIRKEWNFGFDWALPDRRFFLSADYYRSRSADVIRRVFQDFVIAGVGNSTEYRYDNIADLTNAGLELNLGATLMNERGLLWTVAANAWWNRTRIGKLNRLPYTPDINTTYGFFTFTSGSSYVFRLEENRDFAEMWALQYEGIDEAGFWVFKDANRNNTIDPDDVRPVGHALPQTGVGISSRVEWGRLDAQVFLRGLIGHSKVDLTRILSSSRTTTPNFNLSRDVLKEPLNRLQQFPTYNEYYVQNATFFKLDNLVLGYTLPQREGKWMSGWRFYVAGQNLFTFSAYRFSDPEPYLAVEDRQFIPNSGVSRSRYGVPQWRNIQPGPDPESGTYFPSRVLVFGVEANF